MYTNSKIIDIVSESYSFSSFVFLLLILVGSSTIALSLNNNNISNVYGQGGIGTNNSSSSSSSQGKDQLETKSNNFKNTAISPLTSDSISSPQLKGSDTITLSPHSNAIHPPKGSDTITLSPDSSSRYSIPSKGPAYLTVYPQLSGFSGIPNLDICLKYRQEVDTQSHLFLTSDAAPPCASATQSISGFTYTIQAPSTTKVNVVTNYAFNVKTDNCNLLLNPGESKSCTVTITPIKYD
jgi:hypothetical protein